MSTKTITTEVTIEDLGAIQPGDVLLHSNPDGTWTARREVPKSEHEGPKVATLVKRNLGHASGIAHLYRGDPETYIFGADSEGTVLDWGELEGSYKGGMDHEEALRGAGYEVQS